MELMDIIIIAALALFLIIGTIRGFIKQIVALIGWIISIAAAFFLTPYVYKLLYSFSWFSGWVQGLGDKIAWSPAFLQGLAEASGETTGLLISEYIFKFAVFLILVIITGLLWKLIKTLLEKIAELPGIKTVDRILGAILGLALGVVLVFGVFIILYALKDKVPALNTFLTEKISENSLTAKYLVAHLEEAKSYFVKLFDFIKGLIRTI